MNGRPSAEIINVMHGNVARTLTATPDEVTVMTPLNEKVVVPMDMPIRYEAWCLDRGSLLFGDEFKIATEMDVIRFDNGEEFTIMPKV